MGTQPAVLNPAKKWRKDKYEVCCCELGHDNQSCLRYGTHGLRWRQQQAHSRANHNQKQTRLSAYILRGDCANKALPYYKYTCKCTDKRVRQLSGRVSGAGLRTRGDEVERQVNRHALRKPTNGKRYIWETEIPDTEYSQHMCMYQVRMYVYLYVSIYK